MSPRQVFFFHFTVWVPSRGDRKTQAMWIKSIKSVKLPKFRIVVLNPGLLDHKSNAPPHDPWCHFVASLVSQVDHHIEMTGPNRNIWFTPDTRIHEFAILGFTFGCDTTCVAVFHHLCSTISPTFYNVCSGISSSV